MYWHAETTFRLEIQTAPGRWFRLIRVTLRGYTEPGGFAAHLPFEAVGQADLLLEDRAAFVHATLSKGGNLSRRAWKSLGLYLRDEHGIESLVMDRHGRTVDHALARLKAGEDTGAVPA